jgi:hypothetical protein
LIIEFLTTIGGSEDATSLRGPHIDKDEEVLRTDGRDQEDSVETTSALRGGRMSEKGETENDKTSIEGKSRLTLEQDTRRGGRQLDAPPQAQAIDQPSNTNGTDATGRLRRRREGNARDRAQRKLKHLREKLERERKAMVEEIAMIDAVIDAAMDEIVETTGKSHEWWSRRLR